MRTPQECLLCGKSTLGAGKHCRLELQVNLVFVAAINCSLRRSRRFRYEACPGATDSGSFPGDRTVNLLWRIKEGGEAPAGLHIRSAVLQIGTNDFYNHYERVSHADCVVGFAACPIRTQPKVRLCFSQRHDGNLQKYGEVPLSETDVVAEEILMGIIASTIALHKRWPQTHLFVFDILPRGDVEPGVPNPASIHLNWPSM